MNYKTIDKTINLGEASIYELRLLARKRRVKTYRKTRSDLKRVLMDIQLHEIKEDRAAHVIQRALKRWMRIKPTNDTCPITMESVKDIRCFFDYICPSGKGVTRFDASALYHYFMTTYTITNPITNVPLYTCELMRLDRTLRASCGSEIVGVTESCKAFSSKRELMAQQESIMGFLVSEIESAVHRCCLEACTAQPITTAVMALRREYATMASPIDDLSRCDKPRAIACLDECITYTKEKCRESCHNQLLCDDIVDFLTLRRALLVGIAPFFGMPALFTVSFRSTNP